MPDALTNFPNGLSTSVVVLTGIEGESIIDLGTLDGATQIDDKTGLTVSSIIDVTGAQTGTFSAIVIKPKVVGTDNGSGNSVTGLSIAIDTDITGATYPTMTGLNIAVPGGAATNYGLRIQGNGGSGTNWAIYSTSTAPSLVTGPLVLKPAASTIPANNGEMTFSATSNSQITVRLRGTDGNVRSAVLALA